MTDDTPEVPETTVPPVLEGVGKIHIEGPDAEWEPEAPVAEDGIGSPWFGSVSVPPTAG